MKSTTYLLIIFIVISCAPKSTVVYNSDTLKIEKISKTVFQHISYLKTEEFGNVPCNGLIYINSNDAVVFDTPTDKGASLELINWINQQHAELSAVVVTHFHNDCLGGLEEFHKNNVNSYANNLTITLAKEKNMVLPKNGFDKVLELNIGSNKIISQYFGKGHTADNIVGYIPSGQILFGGCLIKAVNAGKGNLEDATTSEWSKTVEHIKNEYPNLKIVVPGHGQRGGPELLDYTIELFKTEE